MALTEKLPKNLLMALLKAHQANILAILEELAFWARQNGVREILLPASVEDIVTKNLDAARRDRGFPKSMIIHFESPPA